MIASQAAPAPHLLALDLAFAYERYVADYWRGDEGTAQFGRQLVGFWRRDVPPQPASAPDAVSIHGSAGHGIAWYGAADLVLGYMPGETGGFAIPAAEASRMVRSLPAEPWE
ncbi:MAG: hypothetical protein QM692_00725 [Thermomicrobiales bacterium]